MAEQLVTQVLENNVSNIPLQHEDAGSNADYNSRIQLNIRGKEFNITRDELMSLPESILLSLFPNGVFLDINGQVITNLTEDDIVYVNFEPACFEYILKVFGDAHNDLQHVGSSISPQISGVGKHELAALVLQLKPAIIVLREDLDFYVIPPVPDCTPDDFRHVKLSVGQELVKHQLVFKGLGYDANDMSADVSKLGPAEKHLFDMLCLSGFDIKEIWGSRSMEPDKCIVSSLLLVRLHTGPSHSAEPTPPESPALDPVASNVSTKSRSRSRIASLANTASRAASRSLSRARRTENVNQSKLLLFWRKPARKCWWATQEILISTAGTSLAKAGSEAQIKVHVRRVWTLELSVVGVQ